MTLRSQSVVRRLLPTTIVVLLLALLVTQSASFVCGAQCLQHHQAGPKAGEMTHCEAMHEPSTGITAQTCPLTATSFCVADLLANNQQKILAQPTNHDEPPATSLPVLTVAGPTPLFPLLRSSIGDPPLLTPLRI